MEFAILGDISVISNGRQIPLGPRQLAVLAVLLHRANSVVPRAEIISLAWGEEQPDTVGKLVSDYVSRLRRAFEESGEDGDCLVARSGGYMIVVDERMIDWQRFCRRVTAGRAAHDTGDLADAAGHLWAGMNEWRGAALANVRQLDPLREQMENHRVFAAQLLAEIELRRGDADQVATLLSKLAWQHPGQERLAVLLLRSLQATGRRSDAGNVYRRTVKYLAEELGCDPSPALAEAYQDVIRDQRVGSPPAAVLPAGGLALLPPTTAVFTGRDVELGKLFHLGSSQGGATVCVIDGMPGVGKTELVLHAAHRLAVQFPDGQLHIKLHAHTRNVAPVEPGEALDRLLRTLGVDSENIPTHLDDRAALYCDRLAGKRALIVLDDAPSKVADIRPLIPAASGCLVLITSRHRLAALDDVHQLTLDTLPVTDAIDLFARIVGNERITTQRTAAERIVALCGGLPLAIRIVAARVRSHQTWRLDRLADRLSNVKLQPFELDDGDRSIPAAFTLSYLDLDPDQRRALRLLALVPGADIDADAAAALIDVSVGRVTHLLETLLDAHLLAQQVEGRYVLHDLMRHWAAARATTEDPPDQYRNALLRWLDHQLGTASAAMDVLFPHEHARRPTVSVATSSTFPVSTPPLARAWLEAERANLLAAAAHASDYGRPEYTWTMASVLYRFLMNAAYYTEALELHRHALQAARTHHAQAAEGIALGHLGKTYRRLGNYEEALDCCKEALAIHQSLNDATEEADMLADIGALLELNGRYEEALEHLQRALVLDRDMGNTAHEASTRMILGTLYWYQGQYERAMRHYKSAYASYVVTGDRAGEAAALSNLGILFERLGSYQEAAAYYESALELFGDVGNRVGEATVLTNLGEVHQKCGELDLALVEHGRALTICQEIQHRSGEGVALGHLAATYATLGQHDRSMSHYARALDIVRESRDPALEIEVLNGLGAAQRLSGEYDSALSSYRSALAGAERVGNRYEQGRALAGMAEIAHAAKRTAEAHNCWLAALEIYPDLGVPERRDLEVRLNGISAQLKG